MYKSTIYNIFNLHVPVKKRYICANEAPFMSKELHKAIMKRSRLRDISLKHWTDTNKKTTALKEISVKNVWKALRNLILKILTLKKLLITEVSGGLPHAYLPKIHQKEKINLTDDGKTISSDKELNQFFSDVVPCLNLPQPKSFSDGKWKSLYYYVCN